MKEHNERCPGKNVRKLGGIPLCEHLLRTLQKCKMVDEIVLDVDGIELMDQLFNMIKRHNWMGIRISPRPEEYCGDLVGGNELLERIVRPEKANYHFMQMHVTSPFIKPRTIDYAFQLLEAHGCAFSVTRVAQRIWKKPRPTTDPYPVNFDPYGPLLRTQDLPYYCHENGAFFAFRGEYYLRSGNRRNTAYEAATVELEFPEHIDIDTEDDFKLAEAVYRSLEDTDA